MSSYIYGHWDGCQCASCVAILKRHNPEHPNKWTCGCSGCQKQYAAWRDTITKDAIAQTMGHRRALDKGMASINTCEREGCDTLVKGAALGAVSLVLKGDLSNGNVERMELCPACVEDVYNVLHMAPLTPRERSYSKPFEPAPEVDDVFSGATTEQLGAMLLQRLMKDEQSRKQLESGKETIDG